MTSANNTRVNDAKRDRQRRDALSARLVIEQLMSTEDGRRWVWLELSYARMFSGDEDVEPYRMAFDKGRRNSGLRLLQSVQRYAPTAYIQMTTEATGIELTAPAQEEPSDD